MKQALDRTRQHKISLVGVNHQDFDNFVNDGNLGCLTNKQKNHVINMVRYNIDRSIEVLKAKMMVM